MLQDQMYTTGEQFPSVFHNKIMPCAPNFSPSLLASLALFMLMLPIPMHISTYTFRTQHFVGNQIYSKICYQYSDGFIAQSHNRSFIFFSILCLLSSQCPQFFLMFHFGSLYKEDGDQTLQGRCASLSLCEQPAQLIWQCWLFYFISLKMQMYGKKHVVLYFVWSKKQMWKKLNF